MNFMKRLAFSLISSFFLLTGVLHAEPGESCPGPGMSYHGRRMMMQSRCFFVRRIETKVLRKKNVVIDIHFNVPVDPRTVAAGDVLLNGAPLDDETRCLFNKAGTEMRILVSEQSSADLINGGAEPIQIELRRAESFSGTSLARRIFGQIGCCSAYVYRMYMQPEDGDD